MTTRGEIAKKVRHDWEIFRAMGWRSPSQTIQHYVDNPNDWDADQAEVRRAYTSNEPKGIPASDTANRSRQTQLAIENIRSLWDGGFSMEDIQTKVLSYIDESERGIEVSRWSLESIEAIGKRVPSPWRRLLTNAMKKL